MAIKEYISSRDGLTYYEVSVDLSGGYKQRFKRFKRGFVSLSSAKTAEKQFRKEVRLEREESSRRGISWGELVNEWFQETMVLRANNPHERLSPETLIDYQSTLTNWTGRLNAAPSSDLYPETFEEIFRKAEILQLSRQHRRRLKRLIDEVFKFGIRKGLVPRLVQSPVENISIGRGRGKRREILTISQIQLLVHSALLEEHQWAKVWAFAYLSLMRSQEMYALTWSSVDFENRQILVSKSYSIKRERLALKVASEKGLAAPENAGIKETKTDDWHYVPMNDELLKLLLELKSDSHGSEFVFERNEKWRTNKLAKYLRAYCNKLGIPSVCFHSLRACGATHLLQLGLEPAKVMKLGGWRSLKSMEHYIRQSGIDIKWLNSKLSILPSEIPSNIIPLRAVQDNRA